MEEVWKQRKELYKQAADIIIDTEGITEEQTTETIVEKLKAVI